MTPVVVSSVPADDAVDHVGALGERDADEVSAVIHGDVRLVIERGHDVRVVGVVVLTLDREHGNVVVAHQASGHVVLRGERVGGAECDIGAAVAQRDHQVSGLGGHVQASRDANVFEWLILDEVLADNLQNLHRLVRPLDALLTQIRYFEVLNVTGNVGGCACHNLLFNNSSRAVGNNCRKSDGTFLIPP